MAVELHELLGGEQAGGANVGSEPRRVDEGEANRVQHLSQHFAQVGGLGSLHDRVLQRVLGAQPHRAQLRAQAGHLRVGETQERRVVRDVGGVHLVGRNEGLASAARLASQAAAPGGRLQLQLPAADALLRPSICG